MIICEKRDELKEFLKDSGIETKIHYPNLIHTQKPYKALHVELPQSEKLVKKILTLPLANVSKEDIKQVCNKIEEFYSKEAI